MLLKVVWDVHHLAIHVKIQAQHVQVVYQECFIIQGVRIHVLMVCLLWVVLHVPTVHLDVLHVLH